MILGFFQWGFGQFNYTLTVTSVSFSGQYNNGNEDYAAVFNNNSGLCLEAKGNGTAGWTDNLLIDQMDNVPNLTSLIISYHFFENDPQGGDNECVLDGNDNQICIVNNSTVLGSLSDYQTGTTSVQVVCSGSNLFNVSVFKETTLPIELLSFSANIHNTQNILTWKTGSEFNTKWHLIERTSEIFNWEKVGKIKTAGFTNHPMEYQWLDPLPFAITYYRIKTVDFDGSVSISPGASSR